MKKFLCFFIVAAVLATVSTTTFAATTASGNKLEQKITKLQARQQKISDKKAAVQARLDKLTENENLSPFKENINNNRQMVNTNEDSNLTALEETNQLRITLAQTLQSFKSSGQKLSDDTKAQLKAYNDQIKDIFGEVKDTKGQYKILAEQTKANIKNKDEAAINDTFAQIASLQTAHNDQIIKVNDILKKMIALIA